ncbi:MAG TPA: DUF1801 domain-containing protein [Anaerolineales bacterium]|nr:DUF1801 domain-containing protein [Anaerolineales bacterium]
MFRPVKARTIREYVASLPKERQKDVRLLHAFIKKNAPTLKPHFANNMLGYGSFPYKNYKKELISWPVVALASQKHYVSLYVCAVDRGVYVAEKFRRALGKVSVGRSCIRFRKLEDVDLATLRKVLKEAAKHPGLDKS